MSGSGGPIRYCAPGWDMGRVSLSPPGRPLVMGIVNLTPDSFFPASRRPDPMAAVDAALAMLDEGADLLDLGAESTRPGADPVPPDAEQNRLLPVLESLRSRTDAPLTVDTRRVSTAELALALGADAVNDVAAGRNPGLLEAVARADRGVVLMHMKGEPRSMQNDPSYDDPVSEIAAWLASRTVAAVEAGIPVGRIVVDPGIGFGKALPHNLALMAHLPAVAGDRPLLLGASRKRFIGEITGAEVGDRLPGSLAALAAAFAGHASVVRVHDVAASVQFLDVLATIDQTRETPERR